MGRCNLAREICFQKHAGKTGWRYLRGFHWVVSTVGRNNYAKTLSCESQSRTHLTASEILHLLQSPLIAYCPFNSSKNKCALVSPIGFAAPTQYRARSSYSTLFVYPLVFFYRLFNNTAAQNATIITTVECQWFRWECSFFVSTYDDHAERVVLFRPPPHSFSSHELRRRVLFD
jgi:hypothetical protein